MIELTNEKTIAILSCMEDTKAMEQLAIDVAVARGFCPQAIYDIKISGESIHYYFEHRYHRSLCTVVHVELSFRDLIENPKRYIKDKKKQEQERFANDNFPHIGSRSSRK